MKNLLPFGKMVVAGSTKLTTILSSIFPVNFVKIGSKALRDFDGGTEFILLINEDEGRAGIARCPQASNPGCDGVTFQEPWYGTWSGERIVLDDTEEDGSLIFVGYDGKFCSEYKPRCLNCNMTIPNGAEFCNDVCEEAYDNLDN